MLWGSFELPCQARRLHSYYVRRRRCTDMVTEVGSIYISVEECSVQNYVVYRVSKCCRISEIPLGRRFRPSLRNQTIIISVC